MTDKGLWFILNLVQVGGAIINKTVTSRVQLLTAAKEIAYQEGLSHINIRAVAARCGVAVGSIYNYFPTKADLVAGVIEDFWRQAAHREPSAPRSGEPFSHYVARLYDDLRHNLASFRADWLDQIASLGQEERRQARVLEANCFDHIKRGLLSALELDPLCSGPASAPQALVDFVFFNLMGLLRAGSPDCAFLLQVLEAALYPK